MSESKPERFYFCEHAGTPGACQSSRGHLLTPKQFAAYRADRERLERIEAMAREWNDKGHTEEEWCGEQILAILQGPR